jgi:CYTH domain-containing protein
MTMEDGSVLPVFEVAHKIGKGKDLREVEYIVPPAVYGELQEYFSIGQVIHKVRHHVIIDGLKWDVDVYDNGMITAELENPPEAYSMDEFGQHVNLTGNFDFSNYKMSMTGYPDYKQLLKT